MFGLPYTLIPQHTFLCDLVERRGDVTQLGDVGAVEVGQSQESLQLSEAV